MTNQNVLRVALLLILYVPLSAVADFEPLQTRIGRLTFEVHLGDVVYSPGDAWIASHTPTSVNTEKAGTGAIAALDKAPFDRFREILNSRGGRLPYGSVTGVDAGPGQLAKGVQKIYHAIEYMTINRLVFFRLEDLEASHFPFSPADLQSYRKILTENRELLIKAKDLADTGQISYFRELTNFDKRPAELNEFFAKFQLVYGEIHKLIHPYNPPIAMQTAMEVVYNSLRQLEADELSSLSTPALGSGFWGGMGLEASVSAALIAAYNHIQERPDGRPITVKVVLFAARNEKNYEQLVKIVDNVLTKSKDWETAGTLLPSLPFAIAGKSGFAKFRAELTGVAEEPSVVQPEAPPASKSLLKRICEYFLK